ncbi:MAG TPA: MFS transporter [Kineosporiaceae bacterium]|nr:MFS transporter [Kineosporiaceae bacterium]
MTSPAPRTSSAAETENATDTAVETRVNRRARVAVAMLFLTNGAVFANLLPRYPQIKSDLGLSNAALGTAIAAFPLGALIAGLTAGSLIHRFRSSRVGVGGTLLTAVAILVAGLAANWWMLAAALFIGGALDALVDVAQNAHGLRVQRRYGRSILNSFHALWSVGAVLGGLMGSAAAGLNLPPAVHLTGSGLLFSAVALGCYRFMLPGPETAERDQGDHRSADRPRSRLPAGTVVVLLALGLIACCGTVTEDAGASWGALYLSGSLGAAAAVAGLAFVALQGMQFIGRLIGDRLVDRYGQRTVARFGGAITALGMGTALAFPSALLTIVGFGAAGFGVATLVPAAMHAADELPGLPPGAGLTVVTWLLRVGFLLSPPIVGVLADASSLRVGLLLVPITGATVIALSRFLAPTRRVTVQTCLPTSDVR